MIRFNPGKWLTALVLGGLLSAASADVLLIELVDTSHDTDLPRNGLEMTTVEDRFGAPDTRHGPVGDPPITRWIYDDFSVYFEYRRVIDSVVHAEGHAPASTDSRD